MQKTPLKTILREEILRGITFALSFGILSTAMITGVAYAADAGGVFGKILNQILASGNWQTDTTGTVKDSQKLGGKDASEYVKTDGVGFTCPDNQCIYKINAISGNPECR